MRSVCTTDNDDTNRSLEEHGQTRLSVWTSGEFGSAIEVKSGSKLRIALSSGADPNELQPAHANPRYKSNQALRRPIEWYVGRQTWWSGEIDALVRAGADPNDGWPALGRASTQRDESVFRGIRLLELGANPQHALIRADSQVVAKLLMDEEFSSVLTPQKDAKPWYMLDDEDLDISSKIVGVNLPTQRHDAEDEQQTVANCTLCGQPLNDCHGYCGTFTSTIYF